MKYNLVFSELIEYEDQIDFDGLNIIIHISRLLNEEEKYIAKLIKGWFILGSHYGYSEYPINYISNIAFEDGQTICFFVDFGGENVPVLNILIRALNDALSVYEVNIEKIELE